MLNFKPTALIFIGMPGSGKSHLLQKLIHSTNISKHDSFVYSTDNYILQKAADAGKTYNQIFQIPKILKEAKKDNNIKLENAFKKKHLILWDQTNVGINKRKKIIQKCHHNGYGAIGIYFAFPETQNEIEILLTRLSNRKHQKISKNILYSMLKRAQPPTLDENFDIIFTIPISTQI